MSPDPDDVVGIAAEDHFAVVGMSSPDRLFVDPELIAGLASAANLLRSEWTVTWDFRNVDDDVYEDIRSAFWRGDEMLIDRALILASPSNEGMLRDVFGTSVARRILVMNDKAIPGSKLNLNKIAPYGDELFSSSLDAMHDLQLDLHDSGAMAEFIIETNLEAGYYDAEGEEYAEDITLFDLLEAESASADRATLDAVYRNAELESAQRLRQHLSDYSRRSILNELMLLTNGGRIEVLPFHTEALHLVEHAKPQSTHSLVRPARINHKYQQSFQAELEQLERMVNNPTIKEREIEQLLLSNPLFLRGLNYGNVYSQVILPRDGGSSLRPDIIAEPLDDDWADIVEIKLPKERVLVGRENRASLASSITSVASQLREYEAYFDDARAAARIEKQYGFKCYKPRLVAIIGRDPTNFSPEETRRAMTANPKLRVVTYDALLRAARKNLLI